MNLIPSKEELKNMSIKELRKKYHIGQKKIQELRKINMITKHIGRPEDNISDEIKNYVKDYSSQARVGYRKMAKISIKDRNSPNDITEWKIRKVFENEDLFLYLHEFKPDPKLEHPLRFVARYAGQAWHTDLHYIETLEKESQKYIIAFLDDRSRKVMHYEILDDRSSITTSNALINALSQNPKPKMLIFDNGKEFVSEQFLRILKVNKIEYHRTHPYTPEENGKIERFWKTIEHAKTKPLQNSYLQWLINQYNHVWSNESLEKLTGKSICSPEEHTHSKAHNKKGFTLLINRLERCVPLRTISIRI